MYIRHRRIGILVGYENGVCILEEIAKGFPACFKSLYCEREKSLSVYGGEGG
jgi:hypothetical protein